MKVILIPLFSESVYATKPITPAPVAIIKATTAITFLAELRLFCFVTVRLFVICGKYSFISRSPFANHHSISTMWKIVSYVHPSSETIFERGYYDNVLKFTYLAEMWAFHQSLY